ncbi:glycerophosphoryl diester phosphodiesterase membrane domain-containing protein [Sphingomonas sp.]|uniref:glycerophosphoryl diester phosphodiesterase membrane domain-containing protein n=1 Tax=Sphingomonas sp. TaxID=28214 RepID=UPI002629824A|nr:glycerophosphoryl diester phosphodiesterase membrane domain-containing protein [Sphingomonas sp.]MDF2494139.1 hypothetical protein [Sphingomonas sp.]
MNPTFVKLLADGWRVFRREADLILRLAGAFLFLPALAVQLLCDPLPPLPAERGDEAAMEQWINAVSAWGNGNAFFYVLADLIGMVGLAAIALLLLSRDGLSVAESLRAAGRRLWRFVLLNLLVAIPVGLGLWLFVFPGLYFQARLIAALPAMAAEPQQSAARAIGRSWRLTARPAWAILGAVVALFLAQWMVVSPLFPLDSWLRQPAHENPFLIALVAIMLTAASTIYNLALLMVGIVVYRRGVSSGT